MNRNVTTYALALILAVSFFTGIAAQQGTRPSRTQFASSAKHVTAGNNVMLQGFVAPLPGEEGSPTGSIEFFDGDTSLGTAALSSTEGQMRGALTVSLPVGGHPITVRYSGDATFRASVSVPEMVIVSAGQ